MARGAGGGPRRPIKGFRAGKEPPELRKQQAKRKLGELNAAQERLVDLFVTRTPEESRALMRRWRIGFLTAAVVLAVVGALAWTWSFVAGLVVHVLAAVLLVLWWRLRRQRESLEAMADVVSGGGRG